VVQLCLLGVRQRCSFGLLAWRCSRGRQPRFKSWVAIVPGRRQARTWLFASHRIEPSALRALPVSHLRSRRQSCRPVGVALVSQKDWAKTTSRLLPSFKYQSLVGPFTGFSSASRLGPCFAFRAILEVGRDRHSSTDLRAWLQRGILLDQQRQPDGSPLLVRDISTQEIYALDWKLP